MAKSFFGEGSRGDENRKVLDEEVAVVEHGAAEDRENFFRDLRDTDAILDILDIADPGHFDREPDNDENWCEWLDRERKRTTRIVFDALLEKHKGVKIYNDELGGIWYGLEDTLSRLNWYIGALQDEYMAEVLEDPDPEAMVRKYRHASPRRTEVGRVMEDIERGHNNNELGTKIFNDILRQKQGGADKEVGKKLYKGPNLFRTVSNEEFESMTADEKRGLEDKPLLGNEVRHASWIRNGEGHRWSVGTELVLEQSYHDNNGFHSPDAHTEYLVIFAIDELDQDTQADLLRLYNEEKIMLEQCWSGWGRIREKKDVTVDDLREYGHRIEIRVGKKVFEELLKQLNDDGADTWLLKPPVEN